MTSLTKKLMMVLIPAVVFLIACVGLLVFLPDSGGSVYVEQIKAARKLAENGDYQNAIVYYKNAIEEDETQEDAYLELANIYFLLNMRNEGLDILRTGITKTNSLKLIEALDSHEKSGDTDDGVIDKLNGMETVDFNSVYTNAFATYNFAKYLNDCTVKNEQTVSDVYTVVYTQYDAVFEYANTPENQVLDPSTGRPYAYARPTAIRLNKLSQLLTGVESGVTVDQLKECRATNIKVNPFDEKLNTYLVTFEYNNMKFTLGCDENGTVKGDDAYNEIVPKPGQPVVQKVTSHGKILDVTTGQLVSNATLKFREGRNNTKGEVTATVTARDGTYSVELDPAEYTVEVICEGYNTEVFIVYIGGEIEITFSISPELSANEIRFVLEWGATPADLDSHLDGECRSGSGSSVSVNFLNDTAKANGKTIAGLDVDDTDGFGPETITLYDTNGTYEYRVHRFSSGGSLALSGATVKIYTSNSSNPIVVTVPDDVDDEWWTVCTIENGEIKDINGKQN